MPVWLVFAVVVSLVGAWMVWWMISIQSGRMDYRSAIGTDIGVLVVVGVVPDIVLVLIAEDDCLLCVQETEVLCTAVII